jgi:hypothetical protein
MASVLAVLVWAAAAPPVWLTVVALVVVAAALTRLAAVRFRDTSPWWAGVVADGARLDALARRADTAPAESLTVELARARRLQRETLRCARRLERARVVERVGGRRRGHQLTSMLDELRRQLGAALVELQARLADHEQALALARAELDAVDPTHRQAGAGAHPDQPACDTGRLAH